MAEKIRSKYPDRIPVIVEKAPKSDAPDIDKKKYLVPAGSYSCSFFHSFSPFNYTCSHLRPSRLHILPFFFVSPLVNLIVRFKLRVCVDITVGKFVYEIRKHMKLNPEQAIFLFVNDTLPPTAALMSQIYEKNKDEDGFLYVTYSGENTFGGL